MNIYFFTFHRLPVQLKSFVLFPPALSTEDTNLKMNEPLPPLSMAKANLKMNKKPPYTFSSHVGYKPERASIFARLHMAFTQRDAPWRVKYARKNIYIPVGPLHTAPAAIPTAQLKRYLLEIIAINLGADFDELNKHLRQERPEHSNSILSAQERANLLQLSLKIESLRGKLHINERNAMHEERMDEVYNACMAPVLHERCVYGPRSYILDLIGSYADHEGDPSKWRQTTLGYWSKNNFPGRRLKSTLVCYGDMIRLISPNKAVKAHLDGALKRYQEDRRLGRTFEDEEVSKGCYKPTRDGYYVLMTEILYYQFKCRENGIAWSEIKTSRSPRSRYSH